jgi:hypothetical protein
MRRMDLVPWLWLGILLLLSINVSVATLAPSFPVNLTHPAFLNNYECTQESYSQLSYHTPSKTANTMHPLILGMPNSGVVWMRDIIEQITKKYGGTIGHANGSANMNYAHLFPNGVACNAVCCMCSWTSFCVLIFVLCVCRKQIILLARTQIWSKWASLDPFMESSSSTRRWRSTAEQEASITCVI